MHPDLIQSLVDARIKELGRTARAARPAASARSTRRAARAAARSHVLPWMIERRTARHA